MMLRYPSWSRNYGADAIDASGKLTAYAAGVLSDLGDVNIFELKRGLDEDLKRGDRFPPSLPQLLQLCKLTRHQLKEQPALPAPKNKKLAQQNIAKLRDKIKSAVNFLDAKPKGDENG